MYLLHWLKVFGFYQYYQQECHQQIQPVKKNLWIRSKALIISNEEMEYKIKIVKLLEESGLLIKGAKTIVKQKNKKDDFFQCHQ